MSKERFQYQLVGLKGGKQMLARFHIGVDDKPASTSVGVVLPTGPEDETITITLAPGTVTTAPEGRE